MSSRRFKRSRNGCVRCKQRKVRCNEQKPVCDACERLNLDCAYGPGNGSHALDQPNSPGQYNGSHRSKYLIRFVDCNKGTAHRVKKTGLIGIAPAETDGERQSAYSTKDLLPPMEDPLRSFSGVDGDLQGSREVLYSENPTIEEHGSSPTQETQSFDQLMMQEFLVKQSDGRDMDPLLSYEMSAQVFDVLDLNLWETPFNPDFDLLPSGDHDPEIYSEPVPINGLATEQTPAPSSSNSSPASSHSNAGSNVQIRAGDHGLIQHFLTVMKQYTTKLLQSSEEDLNCLTFSNLGLFNEQLFHSMLAFAALHRAYTQDSFFAEAELRYQRATALLYEDEHAHEHLDVTISTVWFLLQYELLSAKGIVRFCDLLAHLADVLDTYTAKQVNNPDCISKLGARTLNWISTYDLRALCSGGRGGYLLRSLETFLPIRVHIEEPALSWHGGPLSPLSASIPSHLSLDHAALLRLRLRSNLVHGRILLLFPLDRIHERQSISDQQIVEWNKIRELLKEQNDLFEYHSDTIGRFSYDIATGKTISFAGKMSSIRFNRLLALSSLYAAIIDYDRAVSSIFGGNASSLETPTSLVSFNNLPPPTRLFPEGECAARIVRIAWFVRQNRRVSPQSVWPSLLLAAGFDSVDGVHREWLLNALKEAEPWSAHFLNSRKLLEAVYENQSKTQRTGIEVDILKIQAQTTGPFIL